MDELITKTKETSLLVQEQALDCLTSLTYLYQILNTLDKSIIETIIKSLGDQLKDVSSKDYPPNSDRYIYMANYLDTLLVHSLLILESYY